MTDIALSNQAMALGGLFLAAQWVDQLAREGQLPEQALAFANQATLNTSPSSFEDVFHPTSELHPGLKELSSVLARNGQGIRREVLQYGLAIIAVEAKIRKRSDLMQALTQGVTRAQGQQGYFGQADHESVTGSLAETYQKSISLLSFRIRVTGNPLHLQNPKTAEKIRALLLFGVRCAFLWRQAGGRRWHFMLKRNQLKKKADSLCNMA